MIATYKEFTNEYKSLETASKMLELKSPNGTRYEVEDCYFDLGQGWMWTTIVATKADGSSWQVLNPNQHNMITSCDLNTIVEAVQDVINDKYNPDK